MIAIGSGYGIDANERAVRLAAEDARIYAAVGVHPHDADQLDEAGKQRIRAWLEAPRVVAVGECGLDYWYENSPRQIQREVFAWHVALAREIDRPVTIHVRDRESDAYEELLDIWHQEGGGAVTGVLHCYTHDEAFARRALDQGLDVSFSGILTFKKDRGLRGVAAALPLDRVLVETDAPLLAPQGHRGERNEPAPRLARGRHPGGGPGATRRDGRCGDGPKRAARLPAAGLNPPGGTMSERAEVLALAIQLARSAGKIQRDRYDTPLEIRTKSADIDLVTEVDKACEALIVAGIEAARPADAILAEEGGGSDHAGATWRWIIDPLDGTTNYAHGYPRFCVSIGVQCDGEASVGVVYDPLLDELYTATRGGGAFRNDTAISVSTETMLGRGLVATGFAYDRRKTTQDNVEEFRKFVNAARDVRRDGSAALDLCYVASGRFDGYWELKLSPWDVAAGCLIVEEAGGRTSDTRGGDEHWSGRNLVASNGHLHEAMLAVLDGVTV